MFKEITVALIVPGVFGPLGPLLTSLTLHQPSPNHPSFAGSSH